MPPPSPLTIATSAVNRLVKEEKSYHKELLQQEARIAKLSQGGPEEEGEEGNRDFALTQEVCWSPFFA
jgi:tubulin-specific chaperone A